MSDNCNFLFTANLFGSQGTTSFGSAFGSSTSAASSGFGPGNATGGFASGGASVAAGGFGSPSASNTGAGFGVSPQSKCKISNFIHSTCSVCPSPSTVYMYLFM